VLHMQGPVATATDVCFSFAASDEPVLCDVSLEVQPGEILALTGRSGSGKSTLLLCLAGILVPSSGQIIVDDQDLTTADDAKRSSVRRSSIGFVFQFGELVAELDLLDNVALPLELLGESHRTARKRAADLLNELGLASVAHRRPGQVSGGQAQRAAVARALVHEPRLILADEPTGALDRENAATVLESLVALARSRGTALVIVTHDAEVAAHADRRVEMVDGTVKTVHGVTP